MTHLNPKTFATSPVLARPSHSSPAHSRTSRGWLSARVAAILLAIAFAATGCGGDDDPTPPPADPRINFPGDAATLQEAINMASAGDTVLIGAGTHSMDETLDFGGLRSGVVLVGRLEEDQGKSLADRPALDFTEAGPVTGITITPEASDVTIRGLTLLGTLDVGIKPNGPRARVIDCRIESALTYSISCQASDSTVVIEKNLLLDAGFFGIYCNGTNPQIIGNTIAGAQDCGIYAGNSASVCRANIIVRSTNWGIFCIGPELPALSCNALFDNGSEVVGGDYNPTCVPGVDDILVDPLFCDEVSYALAANSPCSADSAGACGQIGAVGVGCPAR